MQFLGNDFDDPRTQAAFAAAQALLGRGGSMQRLAGAGADYVGSMERSKSVDVERQRRMAETLLMQMRAQEFKRQQDAEAAAAQRKAGIEGAYMRAIQTPAQQSLAGGGGPTVANAEKMPGLAPQVNQDVLIQELMKVDPVSAAKMLMPDPEEEFTLGPGQIRFKGGRQVAAAPKEPDLPSAVQEYNFAKSQGYRGTFQDWVLEKGRSTATTVTMPKIDVKIGEGAAGQVGKMLLDSRDKALSGISLVDSANRVLQATDGGNAIFGPLANVRLRAAQAADTLGIAGASTQEKILNTRNAVRAMAEQAVAARSQLGGQAQISNAEQELSTRATAGDIGDLTLPEAVAIAKLNDKLGRQLYQRHSSMLENFKRVPGAEPAAPFYEVPELPKPWQPKTRDPARLIQEADAIIRGGK